MPWKYFRFHQHREILISAEFHENTFSSFPYKYGWGSSWKTLYYKGLLYIHIKHLLNCSLQNIQYENRMDIVTIINKITFSKKKRHFLELISSRSDEKILIFISSNRSFENRNLWQHFQTVTTVMVSAWNPFIPSTRKVIARRTPLVPANTSWMYDDPLYNIMDE